MIDFEHLVRINDRDDPRIQPLSRGQLWRGLLARAERPQLFVVGLESSRIDERSDTHLVRTLSFGNLTVHDRVTLDPLVQVVHDVEPGPGYPASRLTIRIEEPSPGDLFLRFVYRASTRGEPTGMDRFYGDHVRQAYLQADLDAVRVMRDLAEQGALGAEDE